MPQHLSLAMTCAFRPTHDPVSIVTHVIAFMRILARRLVTTECALQQDTPLPPLPGLAEGSVLNQPSEAGQPWPREDVPSVLSLQQGWDGLWWTQSICPLAQFTWYWVNLPSLPHFTGYSAASSLIIYLARQLSPAAKRQPRNPNHGGQSPFPLSMCVTLAMLLSLCPVSSSATWD